MQTINYLPHSILALHRGEPGSVNGHARLSFDTIQGSPGRRYRRVSSRSMITLCAAALFAQAAAGGGNTGTTVAPSDVLTDALGSGGSGPEMVVIPQGRFRMGCVSGRDCQDRELPVREIAIERPFALSRLEVTRADYARFVEATGHDATNGACLSRDDGQYRSRDARGWKDPGFRQTDIHPVTCVSWNDAAAYAAWLSSETGREYRLPSEAEWEYAARAGSSSSYSWGNNVGRKRANCATCDSRWGGDKTAPAGSFAANAFGLHDMHGNVWEWVQDCPSESYADGSGNSRGHGTEACGARVLRGGSWSNLPERMRSANRNWLVSDSRSFNLGFRVARDISPARLMGGLNPE